MKTVLLVAAMLALVPTASAAAAPAADASCTLLKTPVQCLVWAVKCIGYALGGNPCYRAAADEPPAVVAPAAAEGAGAPDPKRVVSCVVSQAKQILGGVTPMPCPI